MNVDDHDYLADAQNVRSHFDVSTLVIKLLGYDVLVDDASERTIYINGSDTSGLAGHLKLTLENDKLLTVEQTNGAGEAPTTTELQIDVAPRLIRLQL
jgi:hypothetical protein